MTFLKLHKHTKTPFIINMNNVDEIRSNGTGGTEFVYSDQSDVQAIESFEEVEAMLMYAIQFNHSVTSVQDVNLTPKEFVDAGDMG